MTTLYSIFTPSDDKQAEGESTLDLERGLELEWLETNGLGDYASSTLFLCPTRRYHGLLVVRPEQREKRYVFLSRFEERVTTDEATFDLSMARFPDTISPRGDEHVGSFQLVPHPRWTFELAGKDDASSLGLEREVRMVHGARTVLCRYSVPRLTGDAGGDRRATYIELRPLLPFREADALTVKNDAIRSDVTRTADGFSCRPYDALPEIHFRFEGAFEFEPDPVWYENVDLAVEHARGFPGREDHFSPGVIRLPLDVPALIAVSVDGRPTDPAVAWEHEGARRAAAFARAREEDECEAAVRLSFTADDFLVRTSARLGIDAGFPWFTEWGRDTFISLPGLTLARGRIETCEEILSRSLDFLNDGLLPNVFGLTRATSHYGSVDASLWYARAVQLYGSQVGSEKGPRERLLDEYLPALLEIANAYWDGTGLGIRADEGGLIEAGGPGLNATWMDAQTSSGPVTPRAGCAVEINALWYSLLHHVELLLESKGDGKLARLWKSRRIRAKRSFIDRLWLPGDEYLADLWARGKADPSVRPNMVIAAALEHSPLARAQRRSTVERARRELLTPRGLRTLSPNDAAYRPRYEGGPEERDGAYHQGTVWPWLFGFYVEATLRGIGTRRAVRDELESNWNEIVLELDRAGLNHVSEVFDGDAPHRPGGTIAQAWNTAELLRARHMLRRGRP